MTDLFSPAPLSSAGSSAEEAAPLAARMRPRKLEDILGQDHILGPGKLLRRAIEADRLSNMILYGPPGCGKTTLAEVIAGITQRRFERCSGVLSNVAALRGICETALGFMGLRGTLLFIDEIHRFNKAQQDVLLPYVEDGTVLLIGATTHNPQVFINSPLTSRSLVFELRALDAGSVRKLLDRALRDEEHGLGRIPTEIGDEALDFLAGICEGDARRALTALEIAVRSTTPDARGVIRVSVEAMQDCVQRKMIVYDRDEDGHYDTISAFIKSMRGSDPQAAIYWLAKMLEAGEDPRFIARRMVIFASEDVGNADPRGLTLAVAAMQGVEFVGMPEARIVLAHVVTYLATAPKSNASYLAVETAAKDVRSGKPVLVVPEHLKNVHIKAEGHAEASDYLYPHDFEGHHVAQDYLPVKARYYRPTSQGYEDILRKRLATWEARNASGPRQG